MEDTTVVECETGVCVSNLQTARIKISLLNNVNVPISNIININHLISARNSSHAITANSNSIRYTTCVLLVNDMIDLSTLIINTVSRGTIIKSTRPKCNNSHAMATKCARFSQVSGQLALLNSPVFIAPDYFRPKILFICRINLSRRANTNHDFYSE